MYPFKSKKKKEIEAQYRVVYAESYNNKTRSNEYQYMIMKNGERVYTSRWYDSKGIMEEESEKKVLEMS